MARPAIQRSHPAETANKLDRYSVRLRVVEAAQFETPRTTNGVVTFVGGEFAPFESRGADGDGLLLVGTLQLEGALGWRFYALDLRVVDGPLAGAIVHLRDGGLQDSTVGPCVAVYPIPDDVQIRTGPVDFEVVGYSAT